MTSAISLSQVQRQFLAARDVSVPLVFLRTPDPADTVKAIADVSVQAEDKAAPVVQWDSVRGFEGVNQSGTAVARTMGGKDILNPVDALVRAMSAPEHAVVVILNGHAFFTQSEFLQAIWNLRDPFKRNWRTLVITIPFGSVPPALEHDVLLIDEPLPGSEQLREIVLAQFEAAKLPAPDEDTLRRAVDAISGLSAFSAEQAVALSLRRTGLDFDALRERHRQMIENTKGLTVFRGNEDFSRVGGLKSFIAFATKFLAGEYRPGAVLWIDEIEKVLAGVKGDLTGISQDYLAVLLGFMQDHGIPGILLMGHPGTGKSLLAKAVGGHAGIPTIRMDLGAMHGSLVGESQHAIRHSLKTTLAVSQGRPVVIATCNSVAVLPPELINRFKWRFFVDLPDVDEKDVIWQLHLARRGFDLKSERPVDTDWNGREIEQCVETAYQLRISLIEAAQYVVPVAQSSAEVMEVRRREAHGRYLSASKPGAFGHEPQEAVSVGGRRITLKDTWVAPTPGKVN